MSLGDRGADGVKLNFIKKKLLSGKFEVSFLHLFCNLLRLVHNSSEKIQIYIPVHW